MDLAAGELYKIRSSRRAIEGPKSTSPRAWWVLVCHYLLSNATHLIFLDPYRREMASHLPRPSQGRSWTQVLYEAEAKFHFKIHRDNTNQVQNGLNWYFSSVSYSTPGQPLVYLASSREPTDTDAREVAAYKASCQLNQLGYQWRW